MKTNSLKKIAALVLSLGMAGALTACGGSGSNAGSGSAAAPAETEAASDAVYRTLDEIKADGKINIGVFSDKNPFGYVDENGEYQGYDVYFANRLGEDLGVEITMCPQRQLTVSSILRPARSM